MQYSTLCRVLCAVLFCFLRVGAQELPPENLGDARLQVQNFYVGKTVRAKIALPASKDGLEIIDGQIRLKPGKKLAPTIAQPGEELVIKKLSIGGKHLEFLLERKKVTGQGAGFTSLAENSSTKINLRFAHDLLPTDLVIDSLNQLLAVALDLNTFNPLSEVQADASPTAASLRNVPTAEVTADLPSTPADIAELTVEASAPQARVYLDGAYSGFAPRTLRLRAGVHTVLVICAGFAAWETTFFIPGGKASVVRAQLQPAK